MMRTWYAASPLSMAHLCELETPPAELVTIAGQAGIASVGFRIDPASPGGVCYPLATSAERLEVRRRCADNGVSVLYVELISISASTVAGDHRRLFEVGAEIGATRVTVAGDITDLDLAAEKLGEICDLAAPFGLAIDLEFMPFRGVRSLADAEAVVTRCGRPNAFILIDALHVVRSGTSVDAIRRLDPRLVGTFQICDGPAEAPADLILEARTRRMTPGAGQFPLHAMLEALPKGTPIGVEVPLVTTASSLPPVTRLSQLAASTHDFLSKGP